MNLKIGDSVFVVGTADQYHGVEEMIPLVGDSLHLGVLKHGATLPQPKRLTAVAYANPHTSELYEGQLIELDSLYKTSGTWPASGFSASIYVTDPSKSTDIQSDINKNTDVSGTPENRYPVNVIGVVSQYGSDSTGYELIPLDTLDIFKTPGVPSLATIAQARVDANSDGIPDHKVTGDTLMIHGVVTSPNMASTYSSYYVQDATAGIDVYKSGTPLSFSVGDSVSVVGKITQNHGLTEIQPFDSASFALLKHNAMVPNPKHITLDQYVLNPESYEGSLIEIDTLYKLMGSWGKGTTDTLTNLAKTDTVQLYINSYTNVGLMSEPAYPINVIGIGSQYSSASAVVTGGYEIIPPDSTDITLTPPMAPTALVPVNGALYQRVDTLAFAWSKSSTATTTKYLFQLSTSHAFSSYFVDDSNVVDTTKKVTGLSSGTMYFWHVAAYNSGGYGAFSAIDTLTTIIAVPSRPTLISPANDTTGAPRRARLRWHSSTNAAEYHLYISGAADFSSLAFDTTMVDTSVTLSNPLQASTKYYWYVSASDTAGSSYSDTLAFTTGTGIDAVNDADGVPKVFALFQNYPNPFNPSTVIRYDLPKNAYVKIVIYDVLGRAVANLVDGAQSASHQAVEWNPSGLSSGVYFCRIEAQSQDGSGKFVAVKKLLYMK